MKKKILTILLGLAAALYSIPIAITLLKALQYEEKMFTLRQFSELLITNNSVLRYFWLSVGYASLITVFCVVISFPLGFFFAKVSFRGKDALFFVYIMVMMLPFQATLLPNYIQLRDFDLLGSPLAIILPMIFSPFAVFLFRQFIQAIPNDILEYTLLDTSSIGKIFWHVVIPQIKPAIIALAILIFCESWNIVEQALLFLADNPKIMPLSVKLSQLPENVAFAGATMYMLPVIAIFFLFGESFKMAMEKYIW